MKRALEIFVFAMIGMLTSSCDSPAPSENKEVGSTSNSSSRPDPSSNWTYGENKDEMRGAVTKYAYTESVEEFPDSIGMKMEKTELMVQRTGSKIEVNINNPSLQFTCSSLLETSISVKFDSGPVTRFRCIESQGDRFGVAFITPGSKFSRKIEAAKHVTVEANVFQRGGVQMNFNVAGLKI